MHIYFAHLLIGFQFFPVLVAIGFMVLVIWNSIWR